MRAIIYTRFSPRRNAEDSESCETQTEYCTKHAAAKGYPLGPAFSDRELSGSDEDRPGLWQAVNECRKGDVLLVYRRDRLARNVYLEEVIKRQLEKVGSRIEAVMGDIEGDGPEAVMIRQVMASIAEYERKVIGLRTKYAMKYHQAHGRRMSRYAPYGWELHPDQDENKGQMIVEDMEQEAITEIRDLHAAGKTDSEIVRELNANWLEYARGKRWNQKTVAKILARD